MCMFKSGLSLAILGALARSKAKRRATDAKGHWGSWLAPIPCFMRHRQLKAAVADLPGTMRLVDAIRSAMVLS